VSGHGGRDRRVYLAWLDLVTTSVADENARQLERGEERAA
jgi:hypothetical protein